jgi:hypothetical protein
MAPKVHTWLSERHPTAVFRRLFGSPENYQPEISMRLNRLMKQRFQRLFRYVVNNAFPPYEANAMRAERRNSRTADYARLDE